MTKNEQIKQTLLETRERRKTQTIKVLELKVNCHHTSKEDFKRFNEYFKQAKWIINDVIASNDISHFQQDIVNLSKSRKCGNKIGKLNFRSEVNRIPLKTGMLKIKSSKTISIPMFSKLTVYGLEQFINIPNYEIANADIIRKASGIYLKVSVYIPKKENEIKNKTVGLDFGIKTSITTSDGEFFNCDKQESEYLKFLQKQLYKKQKGSKRYWKLRNQIQKEYEHISNQKKDVANKIVAKLEKENDVIYFQDEQISNC